MKDNTSINITDTKTIDTILSNFEEEINIKIWRQMGLTIERAHTLLETIPVNLPWHEIDKKYLRYQAEQFLKYHQ